MEESLELFSKESEVSSGEYLQLFSQESEVVSEECLKLFSQESSIHEVPSRGTPMTYIQHIHEQQTAMVYTHNFHT